MSTRTFPRHIGISSLLLMIILLGGSPTAARQAGRQTVSDDLWSRTTRVFAWDAPHRARYPSITLGDEGSLVVLFTGVTQEQAKAGVGSILMLHSDDRGKTWSEPMLVHRSTVGEPRTMGSLVTLASGELVGVVSEMSEQQPKAVRVLRSKDGGRSWQTGGPVELPGMEPSCPHGQLIELGDGTLIMPVYGAPVDGGAVRTSAGLVRSRDSGITWDDFSLIAADEGRDFTHPALVSLHADSLVAIVASGEELFRCESTDAGRTWSDPEQKLLGREPQLVRIDDNALACLASRGSSWGFILTSLSYDGGRSWRCDRKVMEHPGEPGGHFGWATGLALDPATLIVGFGHTQQPSRSLDGPGAKAPSSPEAERIEIVSFRRDPPFPDPANAKPIPPAGRDQWQYAGSFESKDWPMNTCRTSDGQLIGAVEEGNSLLLVSGDGRAAKYVSNPQPTVKELRRSSDDGRTWSSEPMNLPAGFRGSPGPIIQLSSGRLLCAINEWLRVEWDYKDKKVVGHRNGYAIWSTDIHGVQKNRLSIAYSDDDGRTWHGLEKPVDIRPFDWMIPNQPIFECSDGTIVLPVFGDYTEQDTREALNCTGVLRSTDGGKTWGDLSVVAYDKENRWTAYNEMGIAPINDNLWIAFLRTEYRGVGNEGAWMSRSVTTDGGYAWSKPELCFVGGVPEVVVLPDGGIAVGASSEGLHISYDLGRTWTRVAPGDGYVRPILLDQDTLVIGNGQSWGSFSLWRRVAAGEQ